MTDLTRSRDLAIPRATGRGSAIAVTLVTLAIAIFVAAGFWQLHRARYKDALKAAAEARIHDVPIDMSASRADATELEFRPVHARGRWIADKTIYLDNKIENGVVGYQVITPLRIEGGGLAVLVNRGWIAAPTSRHVLPEIPTADGPVEVAGIARTPSNRFLELSSKVEEGQQNRVWQNLTIERFRAWSGLDLQPVVVVQQGASDDGLKRALVVPEAAGLGPERHRGYALTWFSLAAVTFVLAVIAKLKSRQHG